MGFGFAPRIVTDGLTFYLDAANYKSYVDGATSWNDLTNSNAVFTMFNTPTYTSNKTISLDGVSEYMNSTNSNFLKWQNWQKLSFSIAFKHISATGQTTNRQYIFDSRTNGGANGAWGVIIDNPSTLRELTLFYNTVDAASAEPTITTYEFNTWIVYTFTFDKTSGTNNIRNYVNGVNVLDISVTISGSQTNGDGTVWLGRYKDASYHFNGEIACVSAYVDKILTPEEVLQNYNAIKGRFNLP